MSTWRGQGWQGPQGQYPMNIKTKEMQKGGGEDDQGPPLPLDPGPPLSVKRETLPYIRMP